MGCRVQDGNDQAGLPPMRSDGLALEQLDRYAFRRAQEEDAKKRLERIREVKRGLKNWEGWRLDLVEDRSGGVGGEGIGEIFEI